MNWDGSNVKIIARGIRDTQGFDFDPVTGNIWWTDNGRDDWGNDNPPDELNLITRLDGSQHFGFPYCYGTDIPDPDFNKVWNLLVLTTTDYHQC
jgi:glucose/arabinose dehydrogenase